MSTNKWILTVPKQMHFGFIKDTFGRGAIIELDPSRGIIIVDGRKFNDTRDLEILQRQALKNPGNPWIMPFSPELYEEIKGRPAPGQEGRAPIPAAKQHLRMPVVQDDSSDHPVIDIRDTQISKRHNEEKEAARTAAREREVGRKMEVIRGDEGVEERIARLKSKTDMGSIAERVALKRQRADMPVVHDDSLGAGVGRGQIAMNAGQHLPSREEAEAKTEAMKAEAEIRKQHAQMARQRVNAEESDQDIPAELLHATEVLGGTEAVEVISQTEKAVTGANVTDADVIAIEKDMEQQGELQAKNEALQAENASLKESMAAIMSRLEKLESPALPVKRGRGRPIGSKGKPKTAAKIQRTPVMSE